MLHAARILVLVAMVLNATASIARTVELAHLELDGDQWTLVTPYRYEEDRRYEAGWNRGVDVIASGGVARAPVAGRVRFAGELFGRGVVTIDTMIDGVPSVVTLTGLRGVDVRVGTVVRGGDRVGSGAVVHVGAYDVTRRTRYLPVSVDSAYVPPRGIPNDTMSAAIAERLQRAIDGDVAAAAVQRDDRSLLASDANAASVSSDHVALPRPRHLVPARASAGGSAPVPVATVSLQRALEVAGVPFGSIANRHSALTRHATAPVHATGAVDRDPAPTMEVAVSLPGLLGAANAVSSDDTTFTPRHSERHGVQVRGSAALGPSADARRSIRTGATSAAAVDTVEVGLRHGGTPRPVEESRLVGARLRTGLASCAHDPGAACGAVRDEAEAGRRPDTVVESDAHLLGGALALLAIVSALLVRRAVRRRGAASDAPAVGIHLPMQPMLPPIRPSTALRAGGVPQRAPRISGPAPARVESGFSNDAAPSTGARSPEHA